MANYILFGSFLSLLVFCSSQPGKCFVDNRSSFQLDTVVVNLNGKKITFTDIGPRSMKEVSVPKEVLTSQHDYWLECNGVSKGQRFVTPLNFTDLGARYSNVRVIVEEGLQATILGN
jgi:hypothetical protein